MRESPVGAAHAVQQQVHRGEPRRPVDELIPADQLVLELVALGRRHGLGTLPGVLVGDEKKPSGPAGRVDDRVLNGWVE